MKNQIIHYFILVIAALCVINTCYSKDYRDKILPEDNYIKEYADIGTCKIYYEMKGQGTPLIMIHGGMLNNKMWDPQFNELAKHFKVIRYDARMHGLSQSQPDTFSHHNDLFLLMKKLGIEKAVIMGLSMGGYTSIDFTLEHPEKVMALIAVSPGLTGYNFVDKLSLETNEKLKQAQSYEEAVELLQQVWTDGPNRKPEQVDSVFRNKVKNMMLETLMSMKGGVVEKRDYTNAINRLSEIKVKTFTVIGDIDVEGIIEISEMILKNIKGSKRYVIKGSAHYVNMEKPEEFNKIIIDYVKAYNLRNF